MSDAWDGDLAAWWVEEVADDPAYREDVDPLLASLIPQKATGILLDGGCGDGRLLGRFGETVGVDRSRDLAARASDGGLVAVADLESLPFGDSTFSGAYLVLVLEHLHDPKPVLAEVARVVAPGGWLAVVLNHPVFTAPASGPLIDPEDGEVSWRWGAYLAPGHSDEPAGGRRVRFHHRPVGSLLSSFAATGWCLETLEERPVLAGGDSILAAQVGIPRLLGGRWRRVHPTSDGQFR